MARLDREFNCLPPPAAFVRALALHLFSLVFPKEGYMSIRHAYSLIGALIGAALLSYAAVAFADDKDTPVTLVGCIMKESDYRDAHDRGSGGFLNTGAGTSNEYILTDAVSGPVNSLTPAEADCSTRVGGRDFELKGHGERKRNLEVFVGRRIEISGMLQHADTAVTVGTSGEVLATQPTGGRINPADRDLKLFEVKVDSFREIPIAQPVAAHPPAAAPAAPPEPAPPAPAPPAAAAPTVEEGVVIAETAPAPAPALPRTASPLVLSGLLGLLSLGGAFGLRTWRLW
jgi:hypothetical protein